MIQDQAPIYGDPQFLTDKSHEISDFTPSNSELIRDRGLTIDRLPNDLEGLRFGLEVTNDILGNPVIGQPDMDAIERPARHSEKVKKK